jgi:hypothetical protein
MSGHPFQVVLWCCHVRGPDDLLPAPDYATALKWADICLAHDRLSAKANDPFTPFLSAVPAPWLGSPESHAEELPNSAAYFGKAA